jgi:large subunit ribosomal protein L18
MKASKIVKKRRNRAKIYHTTPVVMVHKTNKNIVAQVFDPIKMVTLFTVSSNNIKSGTKSEKSFEVGKNLGQKIKSLKIEKVVFDRRDNRFHGRVKAVADGIKESNIVI